MNSVLTIEENGKLTLPNDIVERYQFKRETQFRIIETQKGIPPKGKLRWCRRNSFLFDSMHSPVCSRLISITVSLINFLRLAKSV